MSTGFAIVSNAFLKKSKKIINLPKKENGRHLTGDAGHVGLNPLPYWYLSMDAVNDEQERRDE
jgi:hypothetical protein